MMILRHLLILAIVLVGNGALASEVQCQNIDLRVGSVMVPMPNQGSLGWCFAYTAADSYGHQLRERASAFDIAVSVYRSHPRYNINGPGLVTSIAGSNPYLVHQALLRWGVCANTRVSAFHQDAPARLVRIEQLANQIAGLRETGTERRSAVTRLVQQNFHLLNPVFPTSPYTQIRDAFLDLDPREKPLVSLFDNICGDRRPVSHLQLYVNNSRVPREIVQSVRNQLVRGRRPVQLMYNAGNLREPSREFPELNHVSTIVAMRKLGNQCQYLLRNTWGEFRPANYHNSLWSIWNRDDAGVWLPEHMLTHMSKGVYWVGPL